MAVHRGISAEQRREQRRMRLMEAALDMLAERGVGGLRVRAISERARLNDRYFYESFADCRELLLATFDDQFGRALTGIMATVEKSPARLDTRARAVIEFALDFIDDDPRRPHLLNALQTAEALTARRLELIDVLAGFTASQMRELRGADAGTEQTIALTALTVISGLLELTTQWYRRGLSVDRAQFVEFNVAFLLTATDIGGTSSGHVTPPAGAEHVPGSASS